MNRTEALLKIQNCSQPFDIAIIGGGATGLGVAVDAASRGHTVALIEQADFAKGTSSRSTKLVHGGVRYLQQGNIPLVLNALRERGLLYRNAPHLVRNLSFIIPTYSWQEGLYYGAGLKVYDRLAGSLSFGASQCLSKAETMQRLPTLDPSQLSGGVVYQDGQFDDARLAVNLAQTATTLGAAVTNYVRCIAFLKQKDRISGIRAEDVENHSEFDIPAKSVINATGVFVDTICQMDDSAQAKLVRPSQGTHILLPQEFFPGNDAMLIPKTEDGRVLFAIPWQGQVLLGTTEMPVNEISLEPRALPEEVQFLLSHAAQYLTKTPTGQDVLSIFAGLRPLVRSSDSQSTASISRDHRIVISPSGLITVTGGKWTTYRKMAEDVVNQAELVGELTRCPCRTPTLQIHGWTHETISEVNLRPYGADAQEIRTLIRRHPHLGQPLHTKLNYQQAEVIWQIRHEMARQLEDVLARRTRALFLNAKASAECAAIVAQLMAQELNLKQDWIDRQIQIYRNLAEGYEQLQSVNF
ncbi:MAG: glycerol-3-phosphate dehydrogenase/oxidase [Thermosynechococcaceae cyanobacterium]